MAYHSGSPAYVIDPKEVQTVIEVGLAELENLCSVSLGNFYVSSTQSDIQAPCYLVRGVKIWGATAMIVSELLEILA